MKSIIIFVLISMSLMGTVASQTDDWSAVEKVFGKKGGIQDGAFKITFPRYDLQVRVGDFKVAPGLALTTWIGFVRNGGDGMKMDQGAMMMGDIVMTDGEVPAVMERLAASHLQLTALHNHMMYDNPRLFMMHFWAVGDPAKLANGIKAALDHTHVKMAVH